MRFQKTLLYGLLLSAITFSCEDDSSRYANPDSLSEYAKNYLQMKNSPVMNSLSGSALNQNGPMNDSFRRLFVSSGNSTGGRTSGDSTKTDTTLYFTPWVSCATITITNNPDNSITTTYDYGDGCEEGYDPYKYFMQGKYTYTSRSNVMVNGSVTHDNYAYQYKAENYGGRYYYEKDTIDWMSNGHSESYGSSEYNHAKNTYNGRYSYTTDDTYAYNGLTYSYTGSSESSYNEKRFVIEESNATSRYGEDYYHSLVLEPLVMRFDCNPFESQNSPLLCYIMPPIYVAGKEFIKFKKDGKEGSFVINWGTGNCDSIITIEENGKLYKIDWLKVNSIFNQ
jgi:hypothetical protein